MDSGDAHFRPFHSRCTVEQKKVLKAHYFELTKTKGKVLKFVYIKKKPQELCTDLYLNCVIGEFV